MNSENDTQVQNLKIALVHDWLTGMRGGEKILEVLCELFPDATIFTLLHNEGAMSPTIERMKIKTSFIQHLPMKAAKYRNYLPLMPLAIGLYDLSEYDLIISTSSAVAKGAIPGKNSVHICCCFSPMRYLWDQYKEYFGRGRAGILTRILMTFVAPYLRRWDVRSCKRVHYFISISKNVQERIARIYHRDSDIIYPPVSTDMFHVSEKNEGYYLIVSALVSYKRVDLAVQAFNRNGEKLLIAGSGPERARLEKIANKNIEFLGWQSDENLAALYAGCRALIFPGVEDFGIVPLEAMASGKAVVAFGEGGALETVIADGDSPTGIFFYESTGEALNSAITSLSKLNLDPYAIRRHAEKFDRTIFKERMIEYITRRFREKIRR
jgi:glycosyltransferase involved in cell wall biosynthesis